MKLKLFFILLLFSGICFGQKYKPPIQSNDSLEFSKFLSGVRFAYILVSEDEELHIKSYPNSNIAKALEGLKSYLLKIGFETVFWGTGINNSDNIASFCDLSIISTSWIFEHGRYKEISLSFISCNGDNFTFKTTRPVYSGAFADVSSFFYNNYKKLYSKNKPPYSEVNSLKLPNIISKTEWTEDKLKIHFQANGADPIEGIYESIVATELTPKYKFGLVRTTNGYNLIYLSGAANYKDWQTGEIKATLSPTGVTTLFKTEWVLSNKKIIIDSYISFETGFMSYILKDGNKTTFIKLFPTAFDASSSTISGSGTGFAISSNGYIATNYHVSAGAIEIKVKGINGDYKKAYKATIVIEDQKNDLSIIKINDSNFVSLGIIPYVISKNISDVGSPVFALGYPLRSTMGNEIKLTDGIISSSTGFQGDATSYQVSVPVQPGNSGGPLFDTKGNVIGVINARHTGAENVSYAIKASYLLNLVELTSSIPNLQTASILNGKKLTEQVKAIKNFTYIIEIN